ncbi:MAG TPA: transcriptional regulator [Tepidisphaeraceae bacterium]|jgi:DNA-binding MarR family transcriptional regulator
MSSSDSNTSGRFAYDGLERVIHEKARLSILSSLVAQKEGLAFNDLKELCQLTDGNLSRQLQILKDEGFVEIIKSAKNNRPLTLAKLTTDGRKRFLEYIDVLQSVIANAASAKQATPLPKSKLSPA